MSRAAVYLVTIILIHVRADYTLDDSVGLGRLFDGIGGLSAGVSQPGGVEISVHLSVHSFIALVDS